MFALLIIMVIGSNVDQKDYSVNVKAIGAYGSKLECEKAAQVLQQGIQKGSTAVCASFK